MFFNRGKSSEGNNNKAKGNAAEDIACEYLESLGWQIVERNWRFHKVGEIDIIAIDPNRFDDPYLIFVEVKARKSKEDALHAYSNAQKQRQVRMLAPAFIREKNIDPTYLGISFDFIAIFEGELEHLKDI